MWLIMTDLILLRPSMRGLQTHGTKDDTVYYWYTIIIHLVGLSDKSFSNRHIQTLFHLVTLPLWDPSPVEVGAVGYLSKPQGRFITLFNALRPDKAINLGIQSLPSIHGYGPTQVETHRQDRRTVTQKSLDAFAGLLTFRTFSYVITTCPMLFR
jgi:hypothetical protein